MGGVRMDGLLFFGFLLAVFFVMRQVMLWYWRIDEAVDLLKSIDESLKALPAVREMRAAQHRAVRQA